MEACRVRTAVRILIAIGFGLFATPRPGSAQTFELLHSFTYGRGEPYGALLEAPDFRIYGTTQSGGDSESGSVFVLTPDGNGGYNFSEIHSFRGPDGSAPTGALVFGPDGSLYGVCNTGGAFTFGTIYTIDPSGALTTIHEFNNNDGANPLSGLVVGPNGGLYGVAPGGGLIGYGVFYRIDVGGSYTVLHNFGAPGESLYPTGPLVSTADGFYGEAEAGGQFSDGTVFKLDASGTPTLLHEFNGDDGYSPFGGLILYSGRLYGTTDAGGAGGAGTVFSIDPVTSDFQVLHHLVANEGSEPLGRLLQTGGYLYGTTFFAAANGYGSVFRVNLSDGDTVVLHDFASGEGANPKAGLIQSAAGDFLGTTFNGTTYGTGTVFRMDDLGATTTLHFFATTTGLYPQGLVLSSDGSLYGTTTGGGSGGWGIVFRTTTDGVFTDLHDFSPLQEGAYPNSPLIEDSGFFYGTTSFGGSFAGGTVFRVDAAGNFEKVHDFFDQTEGTAPVAGLTKASDGNFYGTTLFGGANLQGIVYRMTPDFGVARIHSFTGSEGSAPRGLLVEGGNQKLYGTTNGAPGTAFRIDFSGNLEPLHTFDASTEGSSPYTGFLHANDGYFYGTLSQVGPSGFGSVIRMDASGNTNLVHAFDPSFDGYNPQGELIEDDSGNLLGTCYYAGPHGSGSIFQLATTGNISNLHGFKISDGQFPKGQLVRTPAGDLYGVTEMGGAGKYGVIYHIAPGALTTSIDAIVPASGRPAGGTSVRILGTHLPGDPTVLIGGLQAGSPIALDSGSLLAISPFLPAGTLQDVAVSAASLTDVPTVLLSKGWFVDFNDVPRAHIFHDFVESIFRAGITAGCGAGHYCPDADVTREQMAVFLLKAEHGSGYAPPACTGVFTDVACTPGTGFPDWIERLYAEGITGGCFTNPLRYCPGRSVTRAEMAVFLLKTEHGVGYQPNPCSGIFSDVPCPTTPNFPYSDWIEQLYAEGVTGGCATAPLRYCPDAPNTRGEMAVFLTKTFVLP